MSISSNFENILSTLNKCKVEYMIAGGYAVNFHWYNRSTSDLDLLLKPSNDNKEKLCVALKKLKFLENGIEQVKKIDFEKPFSFIIGNNPIDVDVFNFITGVKYEDAEKNAVDYEYSNKLIVKYISLKDLIINKMLTNRTKDMADVEQLQKIETLKKK